MSTLGQLNFQGKNKIEVAIERIRYFEPPEGYYLAFSGGKDSIVCKELLNMAKVKYDAHYNNTTADPPELIYYMRNHHEDVIIDQPPTTMWKLIPEKLLPPTRIIRYCCDVLKEGGGTGRFVITGVRWAESTRRKKNRQVIEFDKYGSQAKLARETRKVFLMSDNEDKRMMIETCQIKGKHILNPIIDWEDSEVWEFIKLRKLPYCELYDQGYTRLGCIGCPMQSVEQKIKEFERYKKHKANYIRAFDRMLVERRKRKLPTDWKTGEEVFEWWIGG